MSILWTLIIGFVVGLIARIFSHGKNTPKGFILTALLGVGGSFAATFLGQFVGVYAPGETSGFFGSVIGAVVVCYVWDYFTHKRAVKAETRGATADSGKAQG
ncbi:MAG: GlsB/YeaQ/YmgE family stress response membrane protein [Alphaproteobacteria bacterium]|nr:GlsB/YeaQ/YmgE family stress response membrane protein [Alphaproteobacteria bacterium]